MGVIRQLGCDEEYLKLNNDMASRALAYRQLFSEQLSKTDLRRASHYCQPLGNERFSEFILQKYGIRAGQMHRGRPKIQGKEQ